MKFIECNHCQKRYPSNPKFEAVALRKKVRCTDCGESFPIVIYEMKPEKSH
jgi:NAD-dependent SIR2 family protein deacetylase